MTDLRVDPIRQSEHRVTTGLFVRAQSPDGSWDSVDIADLDAESLLVWLRSRGGRSEWAEQVVMSLLAHDPEEARVVFDRVPGANSTSERERIVASLDETIRTMNEPKRDDETHLAHTLRLVRAEGVQHARDMVSEGVY